MPLTTMDLVMLSLFHRGQEVRWAIIIIRVIRLASLELYLGYKGGYLPSLLNYYSVLFRKKFLSFSNESSYMALDNETLILSYPRSGNHAVRHAVELISKRPTLGSHARLGLAAKARPKTLSPGYFFDPPLFVRSNQIRQFISLEPAAIKSHVSPTHNESQPNRLIYVERDIVEAILSHHRDSSEDQLNYLKAVSDWVNLKSYYDSFAGLKLKIDYVDIAGENLDWIDRLANFMGETVDARDLQKIKSQIDSTPNLLGRPPSAFDSYRKSFPERANKISVTVEDFEI